MHAAVALPATQRAVTAATDQLTIGCGCQAQDGAFVTSQLPSSFTTAPQLDAPAQAHMQETREEGEMLRVHPRGGAGDDIQGRNTTAAAAALKEQGKRGKGRRAASWLALPPRRTHATRYPLATYLSTDALASMPSGSTARPVTW